MDGARVLSGEFLTAKENMIIDKLNECLEAFKALPGVEQLELRDFTRGIRECEKTVLIMPTLRGLDALKSAKEKDNHEP